MSHTVTESIDILILGAGPTGLGAAKRLNQLKHNSWLIIDEKEIAGGLASTDVSKEGFLFDRGGHVIFSHYKYFDDCLDEALPNKEDWYHHQRVSYVLCKECWVAYPFQNNISQLPKKEQVECLEGLIDARSKLDKKTPTNFDEWILQKQGVGLADLFMRPYNTKIWNLPPIEMQCKWVGERVAEPDLKRIIKNVVLNQQDAGWGPNNTFRFPAHGGTGNIWINVAKTLPPKNQLFGPSFRVEQVDAQKKLVYLSNNTTVQYKTLISTIPLPILTKAINDTQLDTLANTLFYTTTHIIGIGVRGKPTKNAAHVSWLYFPESNCPFYRATIFSNYSPNNTPSETTKLPTLRYASKEYGEPQSKEPCEGPYWSIMLEISESVRRPIDSNTIIQECLQGLINTFLLEEKSEVVSMFHEKFKYGYPVPSLDRDSLLEKILPKLQEQNIYSRGRFGNWKYEVANQDHSLMIGVEVIDNILYGSPELTLNYPDHVNNRNNYERRLKEI